MFVSGLFSLILFSTSVYADNSLSSSTDQFSTDYTQTGRSTIYRYTQNENNLRSLLELKCWGEHTLLINTYDPHYHEVKSQIIPSQNEGGCRKFYADHFRERRLTVFDDQDYLMVKNLNQSFYPKVERVGTVTFQHGHPTEKVYVFIPGLYLPGSYFKTAGIKKFTEGHNVILATLPGHQLSSLPPEENNVALWLAYSDYLGRMARHYGKKVIFVGHSIGGNLSMHAAETGNVDELILLQPLMALSKVVKGGLGTSDLIPDSLLKNINLNSAPVPYHNAYEIVEAGRQARLLLNIPFGKINPDIPVQIYADKFDTVISTSAIEKWIPQFAPQSILQFHSEGHMHNPLR